MTDAPRKALDPSFVPRLAYARYLFTLGVRQSRQPEPTHSVALLMLHDAVELFLGIACDVLGAKQGKEFEAYLTAIEEKRASQSPLPGRPGLLKLNKARVALKHHGVIPSVSEVEAHRGTVTTFLQAATETLFGIEFDAVSMIDLVANEKVRDLLHQAEASGSSDLRLAAGQLSEAFQILVRDFEARCGDVMGPSMLASGMQSFLAYPFYDHLDLEVARTVDGLAKAIDALEFVVRTMSIGVDMRRYRRFLTSVERGMRQEARFTAGEAQFCSEFVIETALTLQHFLRELEAGGEGR